MFMNNALTGILFLTGIFVGTYLNGTPAVAWGAIVGLIAANIGGELTCKGMSERKQGLWGFNGILIGCALPTFFNSSNETDGKYLLTNLSMWFALILLSAFSPIVRAGMNRAVKRWGINSLTFPFITLTWLTFFFELSPTSKVPAESVTTLDLLSLGEAWLNGFSQVFLVASPVCGVLFLAGLFVADRRAAIWCATASAIGIALALICQQDTASILSGLHGFNPSLTAIALGAVYRKRIPIVLTGTILTFFVQMGMTAAFQNVIPVLTAPFCVATWICLLATKHISET